MAADDPGASGRQDARRAAARLWEAAHQELRAALITRQDGLLVQVALHLQRGWIFYAKAKGAPAPEPCDPPQAGQEARRYMDEQLSSLGKALGQEPAPTATGRGRQRALLSRVGRWGGVALLLVLAFCLALSGGSSSPATPDPRQVVKTDALPATVKLSLAQLEEKFGGSQAHFTAQGVRFMESVRISLPAPGRVCKLTIALYHTGMYRITLWRAGARVHSFMLGPRMLPVGLCTYSVQVSDWDQGIEADAITVQGVDRNYFYEMGPIRLEYASGG